MTMPACSHVNETHEVTPSGNGCSDCLAIGGRWVHLRVCMSCGRVGCCDSSPNKHASAHFRKQGHPIVQSYEPGEDWWWCYADEVAFLVPGAPSYAYR
jgi:hypothetical protein